MDLGVLDDAAVTAGVVDCDRGPIDAAAAEADWSARRVSAGQLAAWLYAHREVRRVELRGVRVTADNSVTGPGGVHPPRVDLAGLQTSAALVLQDCRLDLALGLEGARLGGLRLAGCHVEEGLWVDNAKITGDLVLAEDTTLGAAEHVSVHGDKVTVDGAVHVEGADTRLEGALRLVGGSVGGHLTIGGGAEVAADLNGWALTAGNLQVGQNLVVDGEGTHLAGALQLPGASISGQLAIQYGARVAADPNGRALDADRLQAAQGLFVVGDGTRLTGALRLAGGSISGQLAIREGAWVAADANGRALDAGGLQLTRGLVVVQEGTCLAGALRLVGGSVGGLLTIGEGAEVAADPNGWALDADGLQVTGDLVIDGQGTQLKGGLRLVHGSIGGQLAVAWGAKVVADANGRALDATGLQVTQDLLVLGSHTRLAGALRLRGGSVGGRLRIGEGADMAAEPDGRVLDADGLQVGQDLVVDGEGTHMAGGLRLPGATVSGRFAVRDSAEVGAVDLHAGDVARLTVDDDTGAIGGEVDLTSARVRLLDDTLAGWQRVGGWRLAGVRIEALTGLVAGSKSRWSTKDRVWWLGEDITRSRGPYHQVAGLYRQAGDRQEANELARKGEAATSGRWRKLLGVVGYGYNPGWAAWWALGLMLVGAAVVLAVGRDGDLFVPLVEGVSGHPSVVDQVVYVVETVLPVVDFGPRQTWQLAAAGPGRWLQWAQYAADLLGWALALLIVGAVTGIIRRD